MSNYADALRRKPPQNQPAGLSSQQSHGATSSQATAQHKNRDSGHAKQPSRPPTEQESSGGPVANAWGLAPASPTTAAMKRPKEAPQVKDAPNKRPKSKKPKPTLKQMSLGDLIPRDALPSHRSKPQPPKPSRPIPLVQQASKDQDFPALGASVGGSVSNPKPGLPAHAPWGKADSSKPPQSAVRVLSKSLKQASRPTPVVVTASAKNPLEETPKRASRPDPLANAKKPLEEQTHDWQSFGAKPRSDGGEELELIRLLQDGKFRSQKKGRQRLAPRKKKFTTLKKKILQERLNAWRELHPEDGPQQGTPSETSPVGSCTVCLHSFADSKELEDDDEYVEIVADLRDMATKVGLIRDAFVFRKPSGTCPAFIWFEKPQAASAACACWDGLVVGGQRLEPIMLKPILEASDESVTNEMWRQAVVSIDSTDKDCTMEDVTGADATASIALRNILTNEDFDDQDCLDESIADIRSLVQQHGSVSDVQARQGTGGAIVVVTFDGGASVAMNAMKKLDGAVVGGMTVSASLWDETAELSDKACIVQLKNALTSDDFEDEECLRESLDDIESLAKQYGPVSDIHARRDGGVVYVTYNGDPSVARNAAEKLDGTLLGGNTINAKVLIQEVMISSEDSASCVVLENILTEDDINDEECLEESIEDVKELASQYGKVLNVAVEINEAAGVVKIEYDGGHDVAASAASKFNGMVIGGQVVVATVLTKGGETGDRKTSVPSEVAEVATDSSALSPLYSGDKLIPERFAECKRVPKVSSTSGPRHYATFSGDEAVKALLIEMLGELMRLQRRAIDDKNAKARRRIVMGLREVARGIRSHKVKMVIMANNLDQYGAIDEKLQDILDLAREEDVPVIFELNKRHLGKAVGKSIKVSVVGIQSAEGAHQQFKKLAAMAARNAVPVT